MNWAGRAERSGKAFHILPGAVTNSNYLRGWNWATGEKKYHPCRALKNAHERNTEAPMPNRPATSDIGIETGPTGRPARVILSSLEAHPCTPELRNEPKRVTFDPPLHAKCKSLNGLCITDCLVLTVWDGGATLKVSCPQDLTDFFLVFAMSINPVFRRCKQIKVRGREIEVEYASDRPCFAL
jgi:hypothetical protein